MARILFVENHVIFAEIVTRSFLDSHYVVIVGSLLEARRALKAGSFDALLLDYDLDDGKGVALFDDIRMLETQPFIVAVSSHDHGNELLVAAGADAVCGKLQFAKIGDILSGLKRIGPFLE